VSFAVHCGDFAGNDEDEDDGWVVEGFASAAAATEYARRFIRAQIEDLRREAPSLAELKQMYLMFGEYAAVEGFDSAAWVDHCIATPASRKADTDYDALDPNP
jgi:hypothetical protein